ncbi:MAG: T9SS type A sorting domain-containing protein [Flavobacterium sp.]|nr:T9SS type A sorting domain-containing protein [Flavobacterium sp.]
MTRIVTDYEGYWSSSSGAINGNRPNNRHNLVAFEVNSQIYSTGVNDAILTNNGISFMPTQFRAFPITTLPGSTGTNNDYIALGKAVDGNPNATVYNSAAVAGLTVKDVLIDGIRGLDIGTGVTNLKSSMVLTLPVGNINEQAVIDNVPDVMITQIADPSGAPYDSFAFVDINGNVVGTAYSANFNNVNAVGKYNLDLFTLSGNAPYATATIIGNGTAGDGFRDYRVLALKFSDFGISAENVANIKGLRWSAAGNSDPAFIAYNEGSFALGTPVITTQPISQVVCEGANATFTVVAEGNGITYQWKRNGVNIAGATSSTYVVENFTPAQAGAYSVQVSNSLGSILSQEALLGASFTIQPQPSLTTCTGQAVNIFSSARGQSITYQWYSNTTNSNVGGTLIQSATSNSYNPPVSSNGTFYYYVVATPNGLECAATRSAVSVVNVIATSAGGTATSSQSVVCQGQGIVLSLTGHTGTIQWQTSLSATTGFASAAGTGATNAMFVPTPPTVTRYYRARVQSGSCGEAFSNVITITVNPTSSAGTISPNQTVCYNASATVSLSGSTGTIQWQQSLDGTTGWSNIAGATTGTFTTAPLTSNRYFRAVVTSGVCSSVTSPSTLVTVQGTNTWTGSVSSDWNTAGNWSCNVIPGAGVDAIIPVTTTYPVIASGTAAARNISIAAGATVTVNGSGVLQVAGSIQNQGTFDVTDGSLAFIGTSAQTVPSGAFVENTVKNLTINATSVTLEGAVDLTGVLSMNAGTFNTGNFLTLKSDASGSAVIAPVTGNVSGEMTIERFIPARRAFRFLSSPVDGGTIRSNWQENGAEVPGFGTDITGAGGAANGFDATATNNPSLYTYWNTNPGTTTSWIAATTTNTPLLAGTPYRMLVRGDRTVNLASNTAEPTSTVLRSTGTIKTGDVVVTDLSGGADRFSLIGNPYQAPVDMDLVLQESTLIKNTFYTIWDPNVATRGAYVTVVFGSPEVNTVSGSLANRFLQPGQAAFVQGSDNGSAMITFKESHKNVGPVQAPVFRMSGTVATIRGTLYDAASLASNGSAADGFLVAFGDDYSNELNSLDAIKPGNQDENAGLMNSGKVLSYETRNYPVSTDVLPLSNTQYRSTNYTYRMTVSGLSDVTAMLLDKHTNTTYELANDESTDISFTVDANNPSSVAANRFDIIFGTALGNNDQVFANAVRLYPNPTESGSFSIQLPSAEPVKVTMTSILGQQVFEREFAATSNVLNIAPNQLQAGVYLVKVASANGTTIKKLIVK